MSGQGFSVNTEKLLDVANSVQRLRDDLAGSGSVAGSLAQYTTKADSSVLKAALSSFWDGQDVFAAAYEREHNGIVVTMQSMLEQLDALEKVCRTTAAQYRTHEGDSKIAVTKTEPGAWSSTHRSEA